MKLRFLRSFDSIFPALLFLQLILIFLNFDFQIYMGGDAHADILLAKSILSGNGFRDIWDPQEPQDNWRRPGMPVLIALLYLLFGHHYLIIKLLIVLLTLGATALLYLIFKDEMGTDLWLLLLLFISNAVILEFAHYELSEIPYLFVALLSIYFWKKQKYIGAILCLIIAYHIRTEALALIGAYLIYYLLQKNWKKFLIFGASISLGILPWTLRSIMVGSNQQLKVLSAKNEYGLDSGMIGFIDLIQRIIHNFKVYFFKYGGVVILNTEGFFSFLLVLLALIGLIKFLKMSRISKIIFLFVIFHLLVMLLWQPSATHYRYLVTISPFLMLGFIYGFSGIIKSLRRVNFKKLMMVIVILNFMLLLPKIINHWPILITSLGGDFRVGNSRKLNDLLEAFDWLKGQKERGDIAPDAVMISRKPHFSYYYSGVKSMDFPFTENKDSVFTAIIKANLIVATTSAGTSAAFLNPVLLDSLKYFKAIYKSEGIIPYVVIFAVKKDEVAKLFEKRP